MILNAMENRPLPVYGDGMQVRDWLFVDDHCRAILAVLKGGRTGETYNVGGNRSLPNLDVVRMVLKATGRPESLIQYVTDRPGHDRRYALSSAKLTRETGSSLLLITHDLGVVARYADRVAVMYGGRIVETAPARELYKHPHHPYTLGLMASVPRLDGDAGGQLVPIEGQPPDLAHLPPGCAFSPRCGKASDACRAARPQLVEVAARHFKACFNDVRA